MVSLPLPRRSGRRRTATKPYGDYGSPPKVQARKAVRAKKITDNAPLPNSEQEGQSQLQSGQEQQARQEQQPGYAPQLSLEPQPRQEQQPTYASQLSLEQQLRYAPQISLEIQPRYLSHPSQGQQPWQDQQSRYAPQLDEQYVQQLTGTRDTTSRPCREASDSVSRGRTRKRKFRDDSTHQDDAPQTGAIDSNYPFSYGNRPTKQRAMAADTVIHRSIEVPPETQGEEARPVSNRESENKENIRPAFEEVETIIREEEEPEWTQGPRYDPIEYRHGQVEREVFEDVQYTKDLIESHVVKIRKLEAEVRSLRRSLNVLGKVVRQQGGELRDTTQQDSTLEQYATPIPAAPKTSTRPIDARILKRLDELRGTNRQDLNFKTLSDAFFNHFGIEWTLVDSQIPPEVEGAYYLRAEAQVRFDAQRRAADENITLAADRITNEWAAHPTNNPELSKRFAELFVQVCNRLAMGNDIEPSSQQSAPRRALRPLAPSAME